MATLKTIENTAYTKYPAFKGGTQVFKTYGSYAKTAALPDDGDYLVLAEGLTHDTIIHKLCLTHGAISGMTDCDIVLLDPAGAVVSTTASAVVYIAEALSFASARANAKVNTNLQKPIKDLIGIGGDAAEAYYTLAMLTNTGGSTANVQIDFDVEFSSPAC